MPWKVFKDGNQFCVHKLNSDGSKGAKVACHPSEDKASAQLKALYANEPKESVMDKTNLKEERREDVSSADKARAEKEYGNVQYADPENKKYPIDAKHVHAAWNYINKAKNAGKYSSAKLAKMKSRIISAFKKYTGHEPPSVAEKESAMETDQDSDEMMSHMFDAMAGEMDDMDGCPKCGGQMKDGKCMECGYDMKSKEAMDTSQAPQLMQATEHEHPHQHGTLTHSHKHQHDREHGIDGQMGKHDHPHADEENPTEDKGETAKDEKEEDKSKKESYRTLVFGEAVSLRESAVDKAHKTIDVTLIKPGWSMNGRYYSKETLSRAVGIFEGTKAFADHPSKFEDENRPERSVTDITGYYTNVRQAQDGSLKATRHFIGKKGEEVYQLALAAIDKPDLMGLSINTMGKTKIGEADGRTGVIVEDLVKSFSVDDVTVASAGGKYDRLMQSGDEMTQALLQSLTYEEWRSANPEFEARVKKEMRTARKEELEADALREVAGLRESLTAKDGELAAHNETITRLNESVAKLQKELADKEQETVDRVNGVLVELKLTQSRLPKDWCESLRPQLKGKSSEEMDVLVESERKKFFSRKEVVIVENAASESPENMQPRNAKVSAVLEALHIDSDVIPGETENVNEYLARKHKAQKGK